VVSKLHNYFQTNIFIARGLAYPISALNLFLMLKMLILKLDLYNWWSIL